MSLYLKAWSVTLDKAYLIIATNELHQTETPNLGKSPSVGFKKPESLPDKITAREYRKLTQLSDLHNSAESDWSLETYTMSHFLTYPYGLLSKDIVFSIICENFSWKNAPVAALTQNKWYSHNMG